MNVGDIVKMKWLSSWDKYSSASAKSEWLDRYKDHIGIVITVYNKMWTTHQNIEVRWFNLGSTTNLTEENLLVVSEKIIGECNDDFQDNERTSAQPQ